MTISCKHYIARASVIKAFPQPLHRRLEPARDFAPLRLVSCICGLDSSPRRGSS